MITVIFCVAPVPVFKVVTHILVTCKDDKTVAQSLEKATSLIFRPHLSFFPRNLRVSQHFYCLKHFTLIRTYIIAQFVYISGAK